MAAAGGVVGGRSISYQAYHSKACGRAEPSPGAFELQAIKPKPTAHTACAATLASPPSKQPAKSRVGWELALAGPATHRGMVA